MKPAKTQLSWFAPKRRGPNPETKLVASILAVLSIKYKGRLLVWRNQSGSVRDARGNLLRLGPKGSADILGLLKGGRLLAIEVKTPEGELTDHQEAWLDLVRELGAVVGVARSVNEAIELVEEAL